MKKLFQLTVLGARGSMSACGSENHLFGGDTSCYMICAEEETVFLDGGSGLLSAPGSYPKPPAILLSHLHLDHIIGLGMFRGFTDPEKRARLYVPFCADSEEAAAKMARVYSPPFWPLRLDELEGKPEILSMPSHFQIGEILVETMEGNHPDGGMIFRLTFDGRSIVYITDYEHSEPSFSNLAAFAKNADLLLYDGQYTQEEYMRSRGFGHSTAEKGEELIRCSGAKQLLLIHHSPFSTDKLLLEREKALAVEGVSYAREGQVISIGS